MRDHLILLDVLKDDEVTLIFVLSIVELARGCSIAAREETSVSRNSRAYCLVKGACRALGVGSRCEFVIFEVFQLAKDFQ